MEKRSGRERVRDKARVGLVLGMNALFYAAYRARQTYRQAAEQAPVGALRLADTARHIGSLAREWTGSFLEDVADRLDPPPAPSDRSLVRPLGGVPTGRERESL